MPNSNAFSGVGTQFKRGDGASSESFVAVAEVNSISGPDISRDTIDVTTLDSTGGYREFIGGFRDGGEISLDMNFTLATYGLLKVDFEASASKNYQIVFSDTGATMFAFTGWVTNMGMAVPLDDKVTASVTIKVDGQITITS